jgi:prephenate dehydratase
MAARAVFGSDIVSIHTRRFRDIFEEVARGSAHFGIVPLENALAGSVHENFDLLAEFNCSIVAEYYCPVELHLMVKRRADGCAVGVSELQAVTSHAKALEQCSHFLEQHGHLSQRVESDTAGAAQLVAESSNGSLAAIASEEAAHVFNLEIVARSIQNHATNVTRFVAISRSATPLDASNKCSVMCTLIHQPGSLHRLLGAVTEHGLNLTKIESRPILGKPFEYTFYADLELSDQSKASLGDLLERVRPFASEFRVLGTYAAQSWSARSS